MTANFEQEEFDRVRDIGMEPLKRKGVYSDEHIMGCAQPFAEKV